MGGMGGMGGGMGGMGGMGGSGGMGGAGGSMAVPDVSGPIITTFIHENGETDVPGDPAAAKIYALVHQGGDTFSAPIDGVINANGTFTIPGVPDGPYYLVFENVANGFKTFLVTSKRTIDLGGHRPGRPDAMRAMVAPTNLELNIDGLNPFQTTDRLELYSLGSLTFVWNMQLNYLTPALMPGATTLAATTDVTKYLFKGLIDGSKGDAAYVSQLVGMTDGGTVYSALKKIYKPASFTMADGATTVMPAGSFEDVPQKPFNLTWMRDAFASLGAQVHPDAQLGTDYVQLRVEPGGPDRLTSNVPALVDVAKNDGSPTVNISIQYGNPYPAGWAEIITGYTQFSRKFTLPGDPKEYQQGGFIMAEMPLNGQSDVVLEPKLSPPANITIGGMPATTDLSGVGTSPKVEWQPPSLGTASLYRIYLFEVDPALTYPKIVGTMATASTSVVLPPGLLAAGKWYTMQLVAQQNGSDTALFRSLRQHQAMALTSAFTP